MKVEVNTMKYLILILFMLPYLGHAEQVKIVDDKIEQRRESLTLNKVVFVDHQLNRVEVNEGWFGSNNHTIKVSLQKAGSRKTSTDFLEVWSVLKNHTDYDLQVEGRTLFFDKDEVPVDDQTAWKRMYISANSFGTYREVSISPLAAYFVIELREGK